MHQIPNKVDFYITNVCNLTCDNCNRFNNYNFKGWQDWKDFESVYQQWGQLVELKAITIMGGEPMLNPSLKNWVEGLNRIFGIEVQILTNGTRFLQNKDLYKSLLYRSAKTGAHNHIGVSLHNFDYWPEIKQSIYEFLGTEVQEYPKDHPKNLWNSDWYFVDKNGIKVNVYISKEFWNSAIRMDNSGKYYLYDNNPKDAHANCSFVKFKSYHFIRGNLYKCAPVALLPEFDQQHAFEISSEDRKLLNSYKPLTVHNFSEYHRNFFENLDNEIPQCKFCATNTGSKTIFPLRKGASTYKSDLKYTQ